MPFIVFLGIFFLLGAIWPRGFVFFVVAPVCGFTLGGAVWAILKIAGVQEMTFDMLLMIGIMSAVAMEYYLLKDEF